MRMIPLERPECPGLSSEPAAEAGAIRETTGNSAMATGTTNVKSDEELLDLLRQSGPLAIAELIEATGVTATAVRQRLNRLMGEGLVERSVLQEASRRGRPRHGYGLTEKARRRGGTNFADLAVALWNELRSIKDVEVRRGLLERIAQAMSASYGDRIQGATLAERMQALVELMAERNLRFEVDASGDLPVLVAHDCPYPDLAECDRGVCASQLLDSKVVLATCRLDGADCCEFSAS